MTAYYAGEIQKAARNVPGFFAAEGLQVVRNMSRYLLVLHGGLQFSSHLVGINNQALAASIGSANCSSVLAGLPETLVS